MASFKMKNQVCVYIFHQSMGSDVLTLPTGLATGVFRKISGELGRKRNSVTLLGKTYGGPSTSISPTGGRSGFPSPIDRVWAKGLLQGSFPQPAALRTRVYFEKTKNPAMFEQHLCVTCKFVNTRTHFLRENASKVAAKKNVILSQCRLAEMKSGKRARS